MKNTYSTAVGIFAVLKNGDVVAIIKTKDGNYKSVPLANKTKDVAMMPLADIAPGQLQRSPEGVYLLNLCTIPPNEGKAEFTFATAILHVNKEAPFSEFPTLETLFAKNHSRPKFAIDPTKPTTFTAEQDGTVKMAQEDSFKILGRTMPLGVEFNSVTTPTSELFCGNTPNFSLKKTIEVFKKADQSRGIAGTDWSILEKTAAARLADNTTAPQLEKKPTLNAGPLQLGGTKQETKKPTALQLGGTKPSTNALQLGGTKAAATPPVMPKGLSNKQKKAWREANLQTA